MSPLKMCLAVTNPSKDEEKPRHRISPCMDVASWTIASILTFPSPSTTPILYHVKDEAKSDIATLRSRTKHRQAKPDVASLHAWTKHRHVKDEAKSEIATLHPSQCCTMSKTKQNPTSHLSVHGPTSPNQVKDEANPTSYLSVHGPNTSMSKDIRSSVHGPNTFSMPVARHIFFADARCVQVHFDAELYSSPEDDVLSRPAKETVTPSSVAAPEQFWEHVLLHTSRRRRNVPPQDHHSTLLERTQRSSSRFASSSFKSILHSFSTAFRVDFISLRLSVFFLALAPTGKHATGRRRTSRNFSCNRSSLAARSTILLRVHLHPGQRNSSPPTASSR